MPMSASTDSRNEQVWGQRIVRLRLIDLEQGRRRKATTVAEMYQHYLTERGAQIAGKEPLRFAWKLLEPVFGH
jgi:hypothetical protein